MTEKRFEVTNVSINGMVGLFKLGNDSISVYDVVRLVNELLEENEQLKSENKKLQIYKSDGLETLNDLQRCYENAKKSMERIDALEEENEQLKSEIQKLKNVSTK